MGLTVFEKEGEQGGKLFPFCSFSRLPSAPSLVRTAKQKRKLEKNEKYQGWRGPQLIIRRAHIFFVLTMMDTAPLKKGGEGSGPEGIKTKHNGAKGGGWKRDKKGFDG